MKRTLFVLLLMFVACNSAREPKAPMVELNWLEDWNTAAAMARDEGRNMIVEFSTEWCPYCEYVRERIFSRPEVAEKMKEFVLLHVDGDAATSQALMDEHGVSGFPTFIIYDSGRRELSRFNDIESTAEFMALLDDLERERPVVKKLTQAQNLEWKGEGGEAKLIYGRVYEAAKETSDHILEGALAGLMRTTKGDRDASLKYAEELIASFPGSAKLPAYYKHISELYKSKEIRKRLLRRAAKIIARNLNHADRMDEETARITIAQHVDLLAEIHREMDEYDEMRKAYLKGAEVSESLIEKGGGVAVNRHLISTVAYYYQKAGEPGRAVRFLKRAVGKLTEYWPVYSSLAKVYLYQGNADEALVHAKRGYELAKEVAKSKLALLVAEVCVAKRDYRGAVTVLEEADRDIMMVMGREEMGGAARMSKELKSMILEYRRPPETMTEQF